MQYKKQIVISILSLFFLTGCFEFVEEIAMNKDGSGSAVFTVNLSQSKTKLASIMLLDSINGYKVPSKTTIKNHVKEVVEKIKVTKGISNVKSTLNFDEFIVAISCDFDKVETLNEVLVNFSSKKLAQEIKKNKHFGFNNTSKTFVRSHHFNIGKEFQKTKTSDREIFKTASYTGIYRFASPVKLCVNKEAKIAKSKKAVMLRLNAQDIITNKQTIKNTIQLEN